MPKIPGLLLLLSLLLLSRAAFPGLLLEDPRFALCGPDPELPPRPEMELEGYAPGSLEIEADQAEALQDGLTILRGRVELTRDSQALRTDLLTYDPEKDTVDIEGNVQFWDDTVFLSGSRGLWDMGKNTAQFEAGEYRLFMRRGRGRADLIELDIKDRMTRFEEVDYTTCDDEPPDWKLAAKYLTLDHEEEWGQATHVTLRVKDIPVFYWPYITFPISEKRKSGLLPPRLGSSSKSGADITLPYYWNIAPPYDATLGPRFLSERGVMLGGEFRYLLRSGRGQLDFGYLPRDRKFNDEDRSLVGFNHQQHFAQGRGNAYLTYARASDKEYVEDFGTSLALTSQSFLEQRGDLDYRGDFWNVLGRVQAFQSIDPTLSDDDLPYRRLPQILFNGFVPGGFHGLNLEFHSEAVNFDRDVGPQGLRLDARPVLSYPIHTRASFLIPRLSLDYTRYALDNTGTAPDELSRTLPIVSLDGGLFLEREFDLGGQPLLQTLEPRLFYLYIPFKDQDDIFLFDTSRFDFSFFQLFRENRFSGPDRIGDANQVTLALTSRLINRDTGLQHLRASIGQAFSFEDQRVTLTPGQPANADTLLETVAELTAYLTPAWSLRSDLILDPEESDIQRLRFGMRYWPAPGTVFNASYRLLRDVPNSFGQLEDIEETDLSFRWPFTPRWSVVGRWDYSLETMRTLEAVGGIEYESCCWGLKVVARRFLSSAPELAQEIGGYETAFYLQLELKGLAGFGRRTISFLKASIPGYQDEL